MMKKKDPTSHRIIEKRRRDRMNNCLADLSKLIPNHYMKKSRGRVEKTEIIEMAIKHLKDLIKVSSSSSSTAITSGPSGGKQRTIRQPQQQLTTSEDPMAAKVATTTIATNVDQTGACDLDQASTPMDCSSKSPIALVVVANAGAMSPGHAGLYGRVRTTAPVQAAPIRQRNLARVQQMNQQQQQQGSGSSSCSSSYASSPSTRAFHAQQYQNNERHINHRASEQTNNKYRASMGLQNSSSSSSSSSGSDTSSVSGGGSSGIGSGAGGQSSRSSLSHNSSRGGASQLAYADSIKQLTDAPGNTISSGNINNKMGEQRIECSSCRARVGLEGVKQRHSSQITAAGRETISSSGSGSDGDACGGSGSNSLPSNSSTSDHSDSGSLDLSSSSSGPQIGRTPPPTSVRAPAEVTDRVSAALTPNQQQQHKNLALAKIVAIPGGSQQHRSSELASLSCSPHNFGYLSSSPSSSSSSSTSISTSTSTSTTTSSSSLAHSSSQSSPSGWCKKAWLIRSFARSLSS